MIFYFYQGLISENPNHRFLGLIDLPYLKKTVTTSSSTSSSTTFLPLPPLPPLSPLPPLPPLSPLLSLPPYYNKASNKASDGARHYDEAAPHLSRYYYYNKARFSGISGPNIKGILIRDTIAFFLIELLPLFISSKIANPR